MTHGSTLGSYGRTLDHRIYTFSDLDECRQLCSSTARLPLRPPLPNAPVLRVTNSCRL
ncbi:uncharacterized protein STEHIDRAFT_117745 [Stereum hirsutum FP-91666 SS1]|uniref:uncharacterized protein n=1 Tax=Stereum hirsutum (strain FP-91666) TaxID=721885 RepID=UPI000440D96F|nr:uncharacterized protein STEHIDRAFT_117745 [Stereum hirsutum FP-91666 SS1]EIM92780.1 hypothetical protein STEHIDRAFT_117745 [Stereum hirsutum FP-91666 SS1]